MVSAGGRDVRDVSGGEMNEVVIRTVLVNGRVVVGTVDGSTTVLVESMIVVVGTILLVNGTLSVGIPVVVVGTIVVVGSGVTVDVGTIIVVGDIIAMDVVSGSC